MTKAKIEKCVSYDSPGWKVSAGNIEYFLTEEGGHAAPVVFRIDGREYEPYGITPWQTENKRAFGGCLKNLRGDFFCMPFGGNAEKVDGEQHPGHGETANMPWKFESLEDDGETAVAHFSIEPKVRPCRVEKAVRMRRSDCILYIEHTISGSHGSMPLGHHPIVKMPGDGKKMFLSFSPFEFGMTRPGIFSDPEKQAYQQFADGERFTDLSKIPTIFKNAPFADGSTYPSRYGYNDLFSVFRKPDGVHPAWTAAVYPGDGYLWFSLKNAAVLPETAVWISNSGRFFAPWSGRTYCIGIEDVCSYFDLGLKTSIEPNAISKAGIPTAVKLNSEKPSSIRHMQGIAPVPNSFKRVKDVLFDDGSITFVDEAGACVTASAEWHWVL